MHLDRRRLLAACAAAAGLAGCSGNGNDEPVEAEARRPAVLPEAAASEAGFAERTAEQTTVETTVDVDIEGDVELSASQDVVATVYRRVYEAEDGRRFGLLTSPIVPVIEQQEVVRDPIPALPDARVAELATDWSVSSVGDWSETGEVELLGEDAPLAAASAEADGRVALRRAHAVAGGEDASSDDGWGDGVTAIAAAPADGPEPTAPFDAVRYGD